MRVLMTGVTGYAGFHAAIAGGDINDASSYRDLLEQCQVMVHTMFDKKAPKG